MNSYKFKSSIKNPLLKQIGSKSTNSRDTDKLNLEYLLDYLKINVNTKSPISLKSTDIEKEIHEPELGEFVDLYISPENSNLDEIMEGTKFKRYGVLTTITGKLNFYKNFSFLSSLITCINDKFISLTEDMQISYLKSLKLYIYQSFTKEFYNFNNYKLLEKSFGFDKLIISKNLYNYEITSNEILVISDIFHINIFILDLSKDKLLFTGLNFVPYKKNIFLLKKENDFYEPLNLNNSFCINNTDDFISYLIENNEKVDLLFKNNKDSLFEIYKEPLEKYINFYTKEINLDIKNKILEKQIYKLNKINEDDNFNSETEVNNDFTENKNIIGFNEITEIKSLSDSSNEFSDNENIEKSYTKTELTKLKISDLILIAKSLNIPVEYFESEKKKKKTKNVLIEEIIKN